VNEVLNGIKVHILQMTHIPHVC